MGLAIAVSAAALLILLVGTGNALGILDTGVAIGQMEMGESSCNATTYFAVRYDRCRALQLSQICFCVVRVDLFRTPELQ